MDKLADKLENLPFEKIVTKLGDILETLDTLLKDPEIKEMVHNLNGASKKLDQVLDNADKLVLNADSQLKKVAGNLNNKMNALSDGMQTTMADASTLLKGASKDLNGVSSDLRKLLQNVDVEIKPVMQEIHTVLISAQKGHGRGNKDAGYRRWFCWRPFGYPAETESNIGSIFGGCRIPQIADGLSGATPGMRC